VWQVILCDSIRQVTLRSSETGSREKLYTISDKYTNSTTVVTGPIQLANVGLFVSSPPGKDDDVMIVVAN